MYIYFDNYLDLNFSPISFAPEMKVEIRPGTIELIHTLDLINEYRARFDQYSETEVIFACEKILLAFDAALKCDPHHLAVLLCRATVCSNLIANPQIALEDLNVLQRLKGYNKDIWILAHEEVAKGMSEEAIAVRGTEYYTFKLRLEERDLYYIRSEMHACLGHEFGYIQDLKKAAFLGNEEAIAKLKGLEFFQGPHT
jgi:hypothetical protein